MRPTPFEKKWPRAAKRVKQRYDGVCSARNERAIFPQMLIPQVWLGTLQLSCMEWPCWEPAARRGRNCFELWRPHCKPGRPERLPEDRGQRTEDRGVPELVDRDWCSNFNPLGE